MVDNHDVNGENRGGEGMESAGKYKPKPNPEFVGLLEAHGFAKQKGYVWQIHYPIRGITLVSNFEDMTNGTHYGFRERIGIENEMVRMTVGDVKHWFKLMLGLIPHKLEENIV